jgi:hypothetical protein
MLALTVQYPIVYLQFFFELKVEAMVQHMAATLVVEAVLVVVEVLVLQVQVLVQQQ